MKWVVKKNLKPTIPLFSWMYPFATKKQKKKKKKLIRINRTIVLIYDHQLTSCVGLKQS